MRNTRLFACLLALSIGLNGCCGTILSALSAKPKRVLIYGGFHLDLMAMVQAPWILVPLLVLDLPGSTIMDTLLLPIAIAMDDPKSQ